MLWWRSKIGAGGGGSVDEVAADGVADVSQTHWFQAQVEPIKGFKKKLYFFFTLHAADMLQACYRPNAHPV